MAQTITFDDLIPPDRGGGVSFDDLTPSRAPVRGTEPKPAWWASLLQGLGQGVSMGWGDELMAAIKTMGGMTGDYGAELENQRGGLDRAREANPGWYMGGEIGGSVGSAFVPMGAAMRGLTMGQKIGRGATVGATQGAIYGAGTGEGAGGAGGKLVGAATGGLLGAGLGAVAAPAAQAIGAGAARVLRGRAPRLNPAMENVSNAFEADAVDLARAPRLGDEGMLLDMGPNLTQEAGAIAALPGEGQRIIRNAMEQRQAGAGGRVRTMMDRALGPEPNVPQTIDDMASRRRAQAGPLYDEAWKTPTPISPKLQIDLRERLPRRALLEAQKLARAEGVPFSPETMDTRSLDYIVRGLDQVISGTAPRSQLWGAYTSLRKEITDELTAANLPLKGARDVWSSSLGAEEALTAGQEVFRRTMSPNELMSAMARMTPAEREAFRKGARDAISEIMGTARNDAGAAFRELGEKGWNKEKLAILVGQDEADRLLQGLGAERTFANSAQTITRNSETARRQAGIERLAQGGRAGQTATGAIAGATATGTVTGAGIGAAVGFMRSIMTRGLQGALAVPPAELDRIGAEMARMLTATGRERDRAIQLLTQLRTQRFANQQTTDAAARVLRAVLRNVPAGAQPVAADLRRQFATPTTP